MEQWISRKRNKRLSRLAREFAAKLSISAGEEQREALKRVRSERPVIVVEEEKLRTFRIKRSELSLAKLGDRILLRHPPDDYRIIARGALIRLEPEQVTIRLDRSLKLPKETFKKRRFVLELDTRPILERGFDIERALRRFKQISCSVPILKSLLDSYSDQSNEKFPMQRVVDTDGLTRLTERQRLAVYKSTKNRLSLVEGVAGSGKTLVAAHIACSMSRVRRRKVLLCSPVEATVEMLAKMIEQVDGIEVSYLPSGANSNQGPRCRLDKLVDEAAFIIGLKSYKKLSDGVAPESHLRAQGERQVTTSSPWLRRKLERKILDKSDIICCNLAQVASKKLRGIQFKMLIIDDAQVAKEIDCVVALMKKQIKQVTFLSDIREGIRLSRSTSSTSSSTEGQPHKTSGRAASPAKSKSSADREMFPCARKGPFGSRDDLNGCLFERLISRGIAAVELKVQYRMHETLATFVNHHFYLSRMRTDSLMNEGLDTRMRKHIEANPESFKWLPKRDCLTAIFEMNLTSNPFNYHVDNLIEKLTTLERFHDSTIGIIFNDETAIAACEVNQNIKVGTVRGFIGQEKDFIILVGIDCQNKRNNSTGFEESDDFLKSDTALNVALTRARLGLFILKEANSESKPQDHCKSWVKLIAQYESSGILARRTD